MLAKDRCAIVRKWYDLMLAHADDLALILTTEQGKPLAEAKAEIAIGAAYVEWFAEEGKRVYGDVIPTIGSRPPPRRGQAARRRVRRDHAVELPVLDDHAQGRARARRRLHRGDQARRGDAVLRARAGRARASRRIPPGRVQRGHRQGVADRRRDVRQPDRAQALVHRLDRSRPHADAAGRAQRSRSFRSSLAATRRSSCSTTPTSTPRRTARSSPSTATPARPACAPTGSSCRTTSTMRSPRSSWSAWRS